MEFEAYLHERVEQVAGFLADSESIIYCCYGGDLRLLCENPTLVRHRNQYGIVEKRSVDELFEDPETEEPFSFDSPSDLEKPLYRILRLKDSPFRYRTMFTYEGGSFHLLGELIGVSHHEFWDNVPLLANELSELSIYLNKRKLKLEEENRVLSNQLSTDYLTGLMSRRHFFSQLQPAMQQALSEEAPLCLIMCDLDHFKRLNDEYGHDTGDEVLRRTSDIILRQLRASDKAGRFGGEEFIIVLPGVDLHIATKVAERIRAQIEKSGEKRSVTASFGVSELKRDDSIESLVKRADIALYEAKSRGRNTVRAERGHVLPE
jgi:diguanylate cyclase (GGDEF)-like protein